MHFKRALATSRGPFCTQRRSPVSEQSPESVYLYEGGPKAGGNLVIKLGREPAA